MDRGQIWFFDIIAGLTIFTFIIIAFFIFTNNLNDSSGVTIDAVYHEASIISDTLLGEGSPVDWHLDIGGQGPSYLVNISSIGLTNGNSRLNKTKVSRARTMGYSTLKLMLKANFDFLVFFQDESESLVMVQGVWYLGPPSVTRDNIDQLVDYDTLITSRRILIYESDIITMMVYVWK